MIATGVTRVEVARYHARSTRVRSYLNADGVPPRDRRWHPGTVARILSRAEAVSRMRVAAYLSAIWLWFVCVACLGSAGNQQSTTPVRLQQSGATTCTSDYGCPYGSHCVKAQYAVQGVCAQVTNAYGVPTFSPPRPSSVGPGGEGECRFDTDCPPTWHCIKGTSLTGNCMR